MSELIQPGSGYSPQPQLSRGPCAPGMAASLRCARRSLIVPQATPSFDSSRRKHLVGVEVLLRERARGPRVARVVACDRSTPLGRLVERREGEQPLADRVEASEKPVSWASTGLPLAR